MYVAGDPQAAHNVPAVDQAPAPPFRADIEGLRGVAVFLVVMYHAGISILPGGFVGVDVFFVLSGYLITGLLVHEIEQTKRLDVLRFYARRARRLLPASATVVLVTLAAGALISSPVELERISSSAGATALYVSNVWFFRNTGDYFAPTAETNPLLHTWSLAVEEQFYALWPLLVWLGLRVWRGRTGLILLLATAGLFSVIASVWLMNVDRQLAFYGSPFRAWEFAIGGLAVLLQARALQARARGTVVLGWVGLATIIASGVLYTGTTPFPGTAALLPVLGTTAALLSGVGAPGRGIGTVLESAPLQTLGRLSYGWYLWHWPALVFMKLLAPKPPVIAQVSVAVAALGLAALMYRTLENPVRHLPRLVARPRLTMVMAAALTIGGVSAAYASRWAARTAARNPEQLAFARAAADAPVMQKQGCIVGYREKSKECSFGAGEQTLVLFGDSHAAQWAPALELIAADQGWRFITLTKASCPAARVTLHMPQLGREYRECDEAREAALHRIAELHPALVVVSQAQGYVKVPGREGEMVQIAPEAWAPALRATLAALDANGIRTVLLRDSPRMAEDIPKCLARNAFHGFGSSCSTPRAIALNEIGNQLEVEAVAGLTHVSRVDLSDVFCPNTTCEPIRKDMVVYRDSNHLTATFVAALAPVLTTRMHLTNERR